MSQIEFTALPGRTFSVHLYDAITDVPIGVPIAGVTDSVVPTRYRADTGTQAGIVYVVASATNLRVAGYANLNKPGQHGYSEILESLQEAQSLDDPVAPVSPVPGDTVSTESIAASAAGPLSISVDGLTVTNRPLADQIAADRHVAANAAASARKGFGVRFARVQPGSAVGE